MLEWKVCFMVWISKEEEKNKTIALYIFKFFKQEKKMKRKRKMFETWKKA